MSKWSIGDIAMTLGTGGAYALYKDKKDQAAEDHQSYANNLYNQNQQNYNNTMDFGKDLEKKLYGNLAQNIGSEAENYMGLVKNQVGQDAIKSDLYRQKSDATISKANAKAGLSGVDTTAGKLQEDRNAAIQAKAVNEDIRQKALGQYGQAVSGVQNAAANLWLGTMGMALGSQQQEQPLQQKGILSEIFS